MPNRFAVYVSSSAQNNLQLGLRERVWGWTDDHLNRRLLRAGVGLPNGGNTTGLQIAASMVVGDTIVVGSLGGKRGDAIGEFVQLGMGRVDIVRVVAPLQRNVANQPWPRNRTFSNQIGIEWVSTTMNASVGQLGEGVMLKLRDSYQRYGVPIPLDTGLLPLEMDLIQGAADVDDLDLDGPTDAYTRAVARLEQRAWRRQLVGNRTEADCQVCQRALPVGYLRVAHIKRRADCTEQERLAAANIMLACVFGCDEMFERGAIGVGDDGKIVVNARLSGQLRISAQAVEANVLGGFNGPVRPFAQAHRNRHGLA